jgi:polyisoprenoid-binding protein YceI
MRITGIYPLTEESREKEFGLRRTMLTVHQAAGFATLAAMIATATYGQLTLNGNAGLGETHQTRDVECLVELSPDTLSSAIRVSAAISSFDSSNSSRDSHAMEAVQSRKFPRVEFASDSIKPSGDGYAVSGKLTFHGQVRPVTFQVTPMRLPGKIGIKGGFEVKLSDFGVERPRLMFMPVEDKLGISFELYANP